MAEIKPESLGDVSIDSSQDQSQDDNQPQLMDKKLKSTFIDYIKDDNPIGKEDQELVIKHAQMFGYVQ